MARNDGITQGNGGLDPTAGAVQPASGGRPAGAPEPPTAEHAPGPTLADPLAEALRLIGLADRAGLLVRLLGGLAFHARCAEWTARIERERRDIDLVTRSRDRKAVAGLMEANGYAADRQYNALYGHKQLYFVDPARSRPVDVLVDRMEMSHTFEFADRLAVDTPTLPLAEMLLSKLQVAHINRKDILDALALLSEYPLDRHDDGAINVVRITGLTSSDWGWWRTVTGNLDKLRMLFNTGDPAGRARLPTPAAVRGAGPGRCAARGDRRRPQVDALEAPLAGRRARAVVPGARGGRARALTGPRGAGICRRLAPSAGGGYDHATAPTIGTAPIEAS